MNTDRERIKSLINAIQLCIKTPIASHWAADNGSIISLIFKSVPHTDQGFEYFKKLVEADWSEQERRLTIKNYQDLLSGPLYNFLMLSRLRDENMKMLAKLDPQYRPFVRAILGEDEENLDEKIESLQEASRIVFSNVEKQKMTLRELAHRSGLTQVAISNFKAGNDVRLSSLIRILKALGLHLSVGV